MLIKNPLFLLCLLAFSLSVYASTTVIEFIAFNSFGFAFAFTLLIICHVVSMKDKESHKVEP